ncbi:biotin synthase BioB [Legionella sp. W05-934-2]|jgi:biotin synthase|uniref:biotin synthase BioB n=1 Tax=Legionella sp. W05-934-2 TaxID=1198649 RepID=UPI003462C120
MIFNESQIKAKITHWFDLPLNDLLLEAQLTHRNNHRANEVELATLMSIKTGACPEDCGYCSQSGHYKTTIEKEKLSSLERVKEQAQAAKANGATRFCMGAAWRHLPDKAMPELIDMIQTVKSLGLEACMTLGMLKSEQAHQLKEAGLDFYNHNIDTSENHYQKIVTTRTYQDRLDTLKLVRDAGISVCCGGIMGMGESRQDRIDFITTLATMAPPPESVPINRLIPVPGTPLANAKPLENFELVRTIACARLAMPNAVIRLSAGRTEMSDELQALCFFAGANSVFLGEKLLTCSNPEKESDLSLLSKLGLEAKDGCCAV